MLIDLLIIVWIIVLKATNLHLMGKQYVHHFAQKAFLWRTQLKSVRLTALQVMLNQLQGFVCFSVLEILKLLLENPTKLVYISAKQLHKIYMLIIILISVLGTMNAHPHLAHFLIPFLDIASCSVLKVYMLKMILGHAHPLA